MQDGNEIRLGPRAPRDEPGRIRLVAHEVAHFAQTQSGRATPVPQLDRDLTLTPEVPAPEITRTPLGVSVTVYFSQGSFLLGASGYQAIERLRTELALMPDAVVRIDGFASAEGAEDFNMRLSEHRRLLIHRLLLSGLTFRPDVTGQAFGETLADESGVSGPERETFRSRQRRVDISIVSPAMVRAAATEPSTPAVTPDLRLRLEFRPETPEERLNRMLSTRITPRPPATFSVCGRWREETRTWFDRRLRDIGVGGPARGILTDLGVGAVERLPFMLIEEGLSAGGVTGTEQRAIMTTIRAACQQEWQP
ncbi:MAG: hypothetical protein EA406_01265 [Rhodospirillales bacterium]|nr:MAG: hypothetical protein EA406_01265 [Rhodospirillales bacterium]